MAPRRCGPAPGIATKSVSASSGRFTLADETKRKEMKAKIDELKGMLAEPAAQPSSEETPENPEGGKKKK